ncbi:MAG: 30S ribosomal protein S6 [bacterium]|nr:30S ribosomal protein S6 [bacterium]
MAESKGRTNNYEAMFLVSQAAAHDLGAAVDHVKEVLGRGKADIIAFKKWDERRLAYEIKKQKRGVYFLTYFSADPVNVEIIERQAHLSDDILRVMVLRCDHLSEEEMRAADGQEQLADEVKLRAEKLAADMAEQEAADNAAAAPAESSPAEEEAETSA